MSLFDSVYVEPEKLRFLPQLSAVEPWLGEALALIWGLVFQHMREVAQRRQQLEVEHEQARLSLLEKQEEVRRLQQVGRKEGGKQAAGPSLATHSFQSPYSAHPCQALGVVRTSL